MSFLPISSFFATPAQRDLPRGTSAETAGLRGPGSTKVTVPQDREPHKPWPRPHWP